MPPTVPLAFIDTETTGIHPGRRVWEVAVIRREPGGAKTTYLAQVSDVDLSDADPYGLRVGRFHERHVSTADRVLFTEGSRTIKVLRERELPVAFPEIEVARHVEQLTRGAHVVGAVPNFDTEVLADMLRRHGLAPAWHYHLIDVEALTVGYLHGKGQGSAAGPPWDSDALTAALGLDPVPDDERHTALGDARWAQRIYDAVTRSQA